MDMLFKIVSGGQTGVDRAALDAAIEMGIGHGGWVPRGRKSEAGAIPHGYEMMETRSEAYEERTERNVVDSDGTLIISHGELAGGSALTRRVAQEREKPFLHIDLRRIGAFRAAGEVMEWVFKKEIRILNVAGPRASEDPNIYAAAKSLLTTFLCLSIMQTQGPGAGAKPPKYPETLDDAVERLVSDMPLKDRTRLARMDRTNLRALDGSLGEHVQNRFGLAHGNRRLLEAIRSEVGNADLDPKRAAGLVVESVWKRLRETHRIRLVK